MAIPEAVQKAIDAQLAKADNEETKESNPAGINSSESVASESNDTTDRNKAEAIKAKMANIPSVGSSKPENDTPVAKAKDQPAPPKGVKEFVEPPKTPSDEKQACVKRIGEILALHNNLESNIPAGDNEYWELVNKYRSL